MTVEDGTGLEDANSYCDVDVADTYHEARGNEDWAAETTAKRASALVRSCDYLERAFGRLWKGARCSEKQRLAFPRYGIEELACTEIPRRLIEAQCEAALLELREPGILSEDASEGGNLSELKEGEVTKRFNAGASSARRYSALAGILAPYLKNLARLGIERA